jgi:hypothetical protein
MTPDAIVPPPVGAPLKAPALPTKGLLRPPKAPKVPKVPKAPKVPGAKPTFKKPKSPFKKGATPASVVAIAAVVLIVAGAVVAGILLLGGKSTGSAQVSVFSLRPGDCLVPPTQIQANLSTVERVACSTPHTQEVFALVKDSSAGDPYVGVPYQHSTLFYTYLFPSPRSWAADDRTVDCVITTTGQKLTASVKGSKR